MKLLILCVAILLTPSVVDAKINHKKKYDLSIPVVVCKEKTKRPVRKIIGELLNLRRVRGHFRGEELYEMPPLNLDMDSTIPIPVPSLYKLKNLA
jgi:hypothetical protein